jgi:hypothetical protein
MHQVRSVRRSVAAAAAAILMSGSLVGLAAPAGAGPAWSIVVNPGRINDATLRGVACTSATNCMLVGDTMGRWNGSKWSSVPSPIPADSFVALSGVACSSATNCFMVGSATGLTSSDDTTLIERWNGAKWSIVPSPNPAGSPASDLDGVSCTSATNCFAVGTYQPSDPTSSATLIERWNGSKWSIVPSPNPAGGDDALLERVACSSATSCIAVGGVFFAIGVPSQTFAERWNGTKWSIMVTRNGAPNTAYPSHGSRLHDVTCVHPTACFAVGQSSQDDAMVERWNGTKWAIVATPRIAAELDGISCVSAANCTAVGDSFPTGDVGTLAEHWDGAKWSIVPTPHPAGSPGSELLDVACTSGTKCVAVGDTFSFDIDGVPLVERSS